MLKLPNDPEFDVEPLSFWTNVRSVCRAACWDGDRWLLLKSAMVQWVCVYREAYEAGAAHPSRN